MKKILACILTLALLVGILPAALGAGSTAAAATPKSIKILSIGEEFSRSVFDYLYKVLEAEGYTDISVAYLHGGFKHSISITDYAAGLAENTNTYHYICNQRDFTEDFARDYSVKMAVEKEDWDYIVLNTDPIQSGQASEFTAALDTMVTYINQHKTNPNAKIGWHMNWAYQKDCAHVAVKVDKEAEIQESFKTVYGSDPDAMYTAILQAAQQVQGKVDLVVPVGTAIMNMKSSYLNDVQVDEGELVVSGDNLTELGKLVASYTWYAELSGKKLEDLNFSDAFLFDLSAADRKVVAEAVNNAVKTPYQLTESSYKTEPVQYNAVVNGTTTRHLPGETVTIGTKVALNAGRKFLNWSTVKGDVTFADAAAQTTSFKMPAQDVEVKAVYEAANEVPGQLKVGFCRVDVTPTESIGLRGYGSDATRLSTGLYNENDGITITAIAISDGQETNVITTMDFLYTPTGWIDTVRENVYEKLGLPGEHLLFSATHTHEAPSIGDDGIVSRGAPYYNLWMDGMLNAVETALNDLKPVRETKISIMKVPGMNWNRHFRNTKGSVSGSNFAVGTYLGTFSTCDQDLQLIRFVRDDAKDVVLINWCGHPTRNYKNSDNANTPDVDESQFQYKLSADYPGAMRRYLEQLDEDCLAAFFLGASGVMNAAHGIDAAIRYKWGADRYMPDGEAYGKRLAQYAHKAMENMTTVETGEVHSMNQQQPIFYKNYNSVTTLSQEAVSIGSSIAFVTAAYEMFDKNAMDVKQASPFDITFVLTCNGLNYIPEWQTFFYPYLPNGVVAYEADPARVGKTVWGGGEDLADGLSAMLNILYAK